MDVWVEAALQQDTALRSFVQSALLYNDSIVTSMRAQLPTLSVPNWISLMTGAPPEISGVLGNLRVPETGLDSIFLQVGNPLLGCWLVVVASLCFQYWRLHTRLGLCLAAVAHRYMS